MFKNLALLFFSYEGRISRLAYLGGFLFSNLILFLLFTFNWNIVFFFALFLYLYILFALVQKRARDCGRSATPFVSILLLSFVLSQLTFALNWQDYTSFMLFLNLFFAFCGLCVNLFLIFAPRVDNPDLLQKSCLLKKPLLLVLALLCYTFFLAFLLQNQTQNFDVLSQENGVVFQKNDAEPEATLPIQNQNNSISLEKNQDNILAVWSLIYRHQKVYETVCLGYGYTMTSYPQKFSEKFKDGIAATQAAFDELNLGVSLEEYFKPFAADFAQESVKNELNNLRKSLIVKNHAQQMNVNPETLSWNEAWDNELTMSDACRSFDENADEWLQKLPPAYDIINSFVMN